jgi:hypothetical protein
LLESGTVLIIPTALAQARVAADHIVAEREGSR